VEQRLAGNQQPPRFRCSAEGNENTTLFSLLQMNSRVEFRHEVEQGVAEATAWYDANSRCAGEFC
jgi:hypothetical protein